MNRSLEKLSAPGAVILIAAFSMVFLPASF